MVHNCAEMSRLDQIDPVWELEEVNWHNHRRLVAEVCGRIWEGTDATPMWNHNFGRLVALLGEPTEVASWNDGAGSEALGYRRNLLTKKVLVAFQKQGEGSFWNPISLGRKIRVDE